MQTRSLTKQALSAVEASATRAQTLAQFKEYTNNLVAEYLKDGKFTQSPSDLDTAITTIIQYIDAMNKDLRDWHQDDLGACDLCKETKRMATCEEDHLSETVVANLSDAVTKVDNKRKAHRECREDCSPNQCPVGQCPEYHNYRKNNQKALWTKMVACANPPPGELADEYIQADVSEENGEKLSRMEACLQDAKDWLDPLYKLYSECEYVETHCPGCQSDCDKLQTDFEADHCQLDISRGIHCDGYYRCWDEDWGKCNAQVDLMKKREEARAADFETGERIRCLLNVLGKTPDEDKPAALEACMDDSKYTPFEPGNEFWINCAIGTKIPPTHLPCGFSEIQPCDADFLDFEYHSAETGLGLKEYNAATYQYIEGQKPGNFGMIGSCTECIHTRNHHFLASESDEILAPGKR